MLIFHPILKPFSPQERHISVLQNFLSPHQPTPDEQLEDILDSTPIPPHVKEFTKNNPTLVNQIYDEFLLMDNDKSLVKQEFAQRLTKHVDSVPVGSKISLLFSPYPIEQCRTCREVLQVYDDETSPRCRHCDPPTPQDTSIINHESSPPPATTTSNSNNSNNKSDVNNKIDIETKKGNIEEVTPATMRMPHFELNQYPTIGGGPGDDDDSDNENGKLIWAEAKDSDASSDSDDDFFQVA